MTTAENGTGLLGANEDTIDPTPELSGEVITAADCQQVANAIAAVEMRHDVTQQCGFTRRSTRRRRRCAAAAPSSASST